MTTSYRFIHKHVFVAAPFLLLALSLLQIWHLHTSRQPVIKVAHAASPITLKAPEPVVVASPTPVPTPPPKTAKPAKASPKAVAAPVAAPTSDIATAAVCPNQGSIAATSSVLLCMTNYARHFHGMRVLTTSSQLSNAAAAKANDIVSCNEFSHTACGHAWDYQITTAGFNGNCSAENIAQGQPTPGAVFVAWMNSPGHRANILNPDYAYLGVAELGGAAGPTWVMEFGGC